MHLSVILKHIRLFLGSCTVAALSVSCNDPIFESTDETPGRFVTFSMGSNNTRAIPIAQLRGEDFGVKAFLLNTQWASGGYNAKPATNWNDVRVSCSNSGICTYTPKQLWEDDTYYSFFAFYPYNAPCITVSDSDKESTPFLEYKPSPDDPTQHRDVMVASRFDCTAVNTGQVRLQFSHVLFCINLAVNNYNDEAVQLENVVCQFTSDLYSTYKINMDKSAPDPGGTISNASYVMTTHSIVPNTASTGAINITDPDRFLMLIPQTGLKGKISFSLTQNGKTTPKEIEFDNPETIFRAGYRYTFTLYFIADAIHFRILQNNEWTDNDSNIEFD